MTKQIIHLPLIFLGLLLCTSFIKSEKRDTTEPSEEYFKIEIVQNDKVVPIIDNTVTLKKEPFKFQVTLIKASGVDVSASWDNYYYDYPDSMNIYECNNDEFEGCRFVAVKTGTQQVFNRDKSLLIGNGDYQWHWFYDETMDWHRFDSSVVVNNGVIHANMTVENIFDCDGRDEGLKEKKYRYSIKKIDKEIYMVFATSRYESGMKSPEELQRYKFKIRFED